MSSEDDATIAFGVLSLIINIVNIVLTTLLIRDILDFKKYQSVLEVAGRYGVFMSLNDISVIFFQGELDSMQVLEVLGSGRYDKRDKNGKPREGLNNPWYWKRVNPVTGSIINPEEGEESPHLESRRIVGGLA